MKNSKRPMIGVGSLWLMWVLAGCTTTQVSQDDFNVVGLSMIQPKFVFEKKEFGQITHTISRDAVKSTTKINNARFDVLGKKMADVLAGLKLVAQAAGDMDLSKAENVSVFEQKLQTLFAANKEAANAHVRMDGRILPLH